jgi:hypothetical protein
MLSKEELMAIYLRSPYLQFQPRPDAVEEGDEQTRFTTDNFNGVKVLVSGNGAGKSENTSFCVAKFLYSTPPPNKITPYYIVSVDKETVGKIWMQKLSKYIPEDQIDNIWWYKTKLYPNMILLKPNKNGNQWMLYFMSAQQGRDAFQSVDAGGYWVDEQVDHSILEELNTRCRTYWFPNSKFYTFTPLKPDIWALELYENRNEDSIKGMYRFYRMNTLLNPYVDQEYKDNFFPTLTPEQQRTRIFGDFSNLSGVVYKYFTHDLILKSSQYPDIEKADKFYCGVDCGYRHPAFVKIAKIKDIYYIFDEYQGKDMLPEELALEIKKRNYDYRYKTIADSEDPGSIRIMNKNGIITVMPNKSVKDGTDYCSYLMYNKKLFFFDRCRTTILQTKSYQWTPEKEGKETKDLVIKTNDHTCDSFRMVLFTMKTAEIKPWESTIPNNKPIQLINQLINQNMKNPYVVR